MFSHVALFQGGIPELRVALNQYHVYDLKCCLFFFTDFVKIYRASGYIHSKIRGGPTFREKGAWNDLEFSTY